MTIGGKTYYFDEDGQMLTGLVEIDGFLPTILETKATEPEKQAGYF